ncbi:MAG TPA: HAMP domain-containing sensor histidine kinase [Gaiellaceae bacterium]|nr:HAMP domain-containing sensor histidine kinase [Gaiellaceae bacterium]
MTSPSLTSRAVPAVADRVRSAPATWAFLGAGALAIAVYFLLPAHGNAQSIFYVVIGFASVVAIYVGSIRNLPRGQRLPWQLFALGLLGQVAGDAIYAVYEVSLNREPPVPSIADAFYLGGYPLLALGVLLILRRLGGQTSRAAILDTLVIFSGVALVQWVFFIDPYNHMHFGTELSRLVTMAYPAVDVLLLVAFAQLLVGPGGRTRAYRLLLVSIALWVIADEVNGLNISAYQGGSWIDSLWLGSYVVWAAAALDPSMARLAVPDRRRLPRLTRTRLMLLAAASLTAPLTLLIERIAHHRVHAFVIACGGAALGGVVLLRLAGLVHAVERAGLAERLARREAEQAQQLLTFQNEQLVEIDRLKDEFVSSISHELRTPLTSIAGYVELLQEEEENPEKLGHLAIVGRNSERLLALVTDLLFAARLQYGRLELERSPVDLRRLVEQCVDSARPRAQAASVRLDLEVEDVPEITGEPAKLAQLLDNLVSNAIKFTPRDGHVGVRLTSTPDRIRIEVSDTGIGIPDRERERLFERFFRAQAALERQIQGTGLGLYISKAIVDAHEGRIGVDSAPGEGTTFIVELPVSQ